MIYFIEEAWNYPDEMEHSYYLDAFRNKEDALLKAKELTEEQKSFFDAICKEYKEEEYDDGYRIETDDLECIYTTTVLALKET